VLDHESVRGLRVTEPKLAAVETAETLELSRRTALYRAGRPRLELAGATALLIDDGVATGATARAACLVSRALGAVRVVLAVPVAAPDWTDRLGDVADELIALATPDPFRAVGQWYEHFGQTPDDEVLQILRRHDAELRHPEPHHSEQHAKGTP
jgi:putative phosphoribosyl transferase